MNKDGETVVILHMVLHKKMCKKLSWCHRFNTLPCVMPRHVLRIQCVQKQLKICKTQYNRWSGRCPCRDALAFFFTIKKNLLSPSENFAKNQIVCLVKMVLCGRKPRSKSSHLHYLLFAFTFFFFVTPLLKKIRSAF